MSDRVITVENLSKRYVIGHQSASRERYTALRDVLARNVRNLWSKTADMARGRAIVTGDETEEFWALRDVSFEVKLGDVLGIIGRNGAGKSTLLKIISRITEPSGGRVTMNGRVASLLEVGTGFHPELDGERENIYLNGAILGMTRAEIRRRFDGIVSFAEVEKFLDTPVKRYSSGMYVRLAFAVAAHLEQEILVVDEVLAVGDSQFQQKCLGKIEHVARGGRTVMFVSRNMSSIQALCSSCLVFDDGRLRFSGPVDDSVREYAKARSSGESLEQIVAFGPLVLTRLELPVAEIKSGGSMSVHVEWRAKTTTVIRECAVIICSASGARTVVLDLRQRGVLNLEVGTDPLRLAIVIPSLPLVEGNYNIGFFIVGDDWHDEHLDLRSFNVDARLHGGPPLYPARHRGFVDVDFSVKRLSSIVPEPAV